MTIDAVVAGAGIWGSTIARLLAESGKQVLVLEAREYPGGNVRCATDKATGIEVHLYGSHIFHTSLPNVWEFVNKFVKFNGYHHKVLAHFKGKTYFLPIGLPLINKFFGTELQPSEVHDFMSHPSHATALFDAFFRGYTSKQWGLQPEEIDPSIIKRVPTRGNYDINYFNDYNQGIPLSGYNSLFDRILDHPNISMRCNVCLRLENGMFKANGDDIPCVPVYYSGPLDALFRYKFGELPWRTLKFETERLPVKDFQGTSVVNYTESSVPFTRIHEFKHFHPEDTKVMSQEVTIISREYPAPWKRGDNPYYPIDNAESREILLRYQNEASQFHNLTVGGRLGAYKYYDMDKSIESALSIPL